VDDYSADFYCEHRTISCTNILVSKGATLDGSAMITYSADNHDFYGELYHFPAKDYPDSAMLSIYEWILENTWEK